MLARMSKSFKDLDSRVCFESETTKRPPPAGAVALLRDVVESAMDRVKKTIRTGGIKTKLLFISDLFDQRRARRG